MTHSSGVNARQPTYDAIIKKTFTEINERPTRRQKDNLLVEVEKVLVGVSVPGFNWSSKYGLLAETRGGPAYKALSDKACAHPSNEEPPEIYPNTRTKWKSGNKEKAITHPSGANARQLTCHAIVRKTITKINDRPTRRQKDNLLVEVEKS